MVGFERSYEDGQYVCKTKLLPLTDVANTEKMCIRDRPWSSKRR